MIDVLVWAAAGESQAFGVTLADLLVGGGTPLHVRLLASEGTAPLVKAWQARFDDRGHRLEAGSMAEIDGSRDLLMVLAGTRLPAGWEVRMRDALYSDRLVGIVSPMCEGLETFSLLPGGAGRLPDDLLGELNRVLIHVQAPPAVPAPTSLPVCCLVRAGDPARLFLEFLSRQGTLLEGEGWAGAADHLGRHGFQPAIACRVWIDRPPAGRTLDHWRSRERKPPVSAYLHAHPLRAVRGTVRETLERWRSGGDTRPVRLHLSHSWRGGLEKWVRQFCQADGESGNLVLKSVGSWGAFGSRLVLYGGSGGKPLASWDLSLPIHATAISHAEYRRILDEVIRRWGVDQIVVSSLIGHSLDVFETGLPSVMVVHDYYPVCPAVSAYFGGRCGECDAGRMGRCLRENPEQRFFRGESAEYWLALRHRLSDLLRRQRVLLAAPTRAAAEQYLAILPEGEKVDYHVIEHGLPPEELPHIGVPAEPRRRLQLVVAGTFAPHKGLDLLLEAWPRMREWVDLHFLGCGKEAVPRLEGIAASVVPFYRPEEFSDHVRRIAPDAGLLLSVFSETFCYTLSELWCMGIPPIATRVGSLAERIEEGETGLLFEPDADALVERVRTLHAERSPLRYIAGRLTAYHPREMLSMIEEYNRLVPVPEVVGVHVRGRPEAVPETALEEDNPMMEGTGVVAIRRLASVHDMLVSRLAAIEGPGRLRRAVYRLAIRLWLGLPLALLVRRGRRR